jgi:hypothetical protein
LDLGVRLRRGWSMARGNVVPRINEVAQGLTKGKAVPRISEVAQVSNYIMMMTNYFQERDLVF